MEGGQLHRDPDLIGHLGPGEWPASVPHREVGRPPRRIVEHAQPDNRLVEVAAHALAIPPLMLVRSATAPSGTAAPASASIVGYGLQVRWGLSISLSGELADPGSLVIEGAVTAEGSGLGRHLRVGPSVAPNVWLRSPTRSSRWRRSPWRLERVRIGTMVTALPRRRTQLVAQATTSLDRLSAGPNGARPRSRGRQLRRVLGVPRAGAG